MKYAGTVFDTNVNRWSKNDTEFDKTVFRKRNFAFVIEDTEGNIFGGFISKKIITYRYRQGGLLKGESITDPGAFTFIFETNRRIQCPQRFNIKPAENQHAFQLFKENDDELFRFGDDEIVIHKKNVSKCHQVHYKAFNYGKLENVYLGKTLEDKVQLSFDVKRLQVWKFKEEKKLNKK